MAAFREDHGQYPGGTGMNEVLLNDLAAHVAQAIDPLPAGRSRKQQMQEELLAHLLAIFDEELASHKDEETAVGQAKKRFGLPDDLCGELQAAVPLPERLVFLLCGKGKTMWRWLWAVGCVAVMVGMGFVLPAIAHLSNADHIVKSEAYPLAMCVALLVLGLTLTLSGLGAVAYTVVKALRARSC
jgi:hypothetical protein